MEQLYENSIRVYRRLNETHKIMIEDPEVQTVSKMREFIERVRESGSEIYGVNQRCGLSELMKYWAAAISSAGEPYPNIVLAKMNHPNKLTFLEDLKEEQSL